MTRVSTAIWARNGRTVLIVTGELDLTSVDMLRETIAMLVRSGRGRIEVDLSRVAYLDSSVIGALVDGRHEADHLAKAYHVTGTRDQVRYVLNAAGVLDYLTRDDRPTTNPPPPPPSCHPGGHNGNHHDH